MATCRPTTYYAYNVPAGMTELDFATMIGSETGGKVRTDSVHIKDNMATLTFKEPGYFAKCFDKVTAVLGVQFQYPNTLVIIHLFC